MNGGNVCSKNEYQPQTVCPESQTGASSGQCQQVSMNKMSAKWPPIGQLISKISEKFCGNKKLRSHTRT